MRQASRFHPDLLIFAFFTALLATAGSLFFSEVLGYIPCTLCWYERILMYPLVLILGVGLLSPDAFTLKYATPLVAAGWAVALYHNLLLWGIIHEFIPCRFGVPCSTYYIEWLGFISIPLLCFTAFSLIGLTFLILKKGVGR